MNKSLIISVKILFVITLFFSSGVVFSDSAEATYANRSKTFSKSFNIDRYRGWMNPVDRRNISDGGVYINHYAGMTKGGYTVNIGQEIDFQHDMNVTYTASGGWWDTPYGHLCWNVDYTGCWGGNIWAVGKRICDWGSSLSNDCWPSNRGIIHWTARPPEVRIESSNPGVVSCTETYVNKYRTKYDCVAHKAGSARLTVKSNGTTARFFALIEFARGGAWHNWNWLSEDSWSSLNMSTSKKNRMWVNGGNVGGWTINVIPPPTLDLSVSPSKVQKPGNIAKITWSTNNATSCYGQIFQIVDKNGSLSKTRIWDGWMTVNGSRASKIDAVNPRSKVWTVECWNAAGASTGQKEVTSISPYCGDGTCDLAAKESCATCVKDCVCDSPIVNLNADPVSVRSGGSSELTWLTSNVTWCRATGGDWFMNSKFDFKNHLGGSEMRNNIINDESHEITCGNDSNQQTVDTATITVCGNGLIGLGEQCDDGNNVDDDNCNNACQSNCGNGVKDPNSTEECDEGANNGSSAATCGTLNYNDPPCTYCSSSCTDATIR